MSEKLELCPKCKKGYFRPTGDVSRVGETEPPFRETCNTKEMVCDNCGQRRADVGINEQV
jgi:C4-type Zn-finger protein